MKMSEIRICVYVYIYIGVVLVVFGSSIILLYNIICYEYFFS